MSAFILEANRENDVLKISLYEQTQHIAHRHYSEKKFNKKEIDNLCQTLISLIDKNTPTSTISEDHYNKIHQYALLLYDTLFPLEIKKKIKDANFTILTFAIDESLVPIPWELLHDGTNFLCLKFAVGRIVRTKQPFLFSQHRETKKPPLKMLLLSNPTGNLEYAYQECLSIRRQLDKKEIINVDTKTTEIDLAYVKRYIRNYDIVHFAGHAEYDQQNPENSGWRLTDGLFSPQIILSLGDSALFPSLIFSNACYSEGNRQWQQDNKDGEEKNYGLASAFLLGGVNHYISTLCRVSDNACLHFSKSFYQQIAKNSSIGESIRQGRLKLIETYGKQSIGWTSYVLYGDPGQSLFSSLSLSETNRKQENKKKKTLRLGALCLSIFCVIILLLYPIYKKKTIVQRHDEKLKNTESTIDQPPKTINWSSAERSGLDGYNAFDGNFDTRWASAPNTTAPQWIEKDLTTKKTFNKITIYWETAYASTYKLMISNNQTDWTTLYQTNTGNGGIDEINFSPVTARYLKLYCLERATLWGYSIYEIKISHNLALKKTCEASSSKTGPNYSPDKAVDGNLTTRWASDWTDTEWFQLDLGEETEFNKIILNWEMAYGKTYHIMVSSDKKNWNEVYYTDSGDGGIDEIKLPGTKARYIKLAGSKKGTKWGYSLWEFEIINELSI